MSQIHSSATYLDDRRRLKDCSESSENYSLQNWTPATGFGLPCDKLQLEERSRQSSDGG